MAVIDLRHATLYIRDGYSVTGTIADTTGIGAGALSIPVKGFTTAIPNGATFTISGETGAPTHTVTGSTGGSTPTTLTFTTAIATGGVANNATITVTLPAGGQLSANATAGDLTISVSGFTAAIPVGATFTIAGETGTPTHTVVSTVGGTNPTSITFTTAIATGGVTAPAAITVTFTGNIPPVNTAPASGDTTIDVTGFTAAIPNGISMTLAGSSQTYTVVTTTGGATPSTITFTPALATADGIPANGATVTIGPNQLTVVIGEGNLTYDEKQKFDYIRDHMQIKYVKQGDEEPMDVSFDFLWTYLSSTGSETPTVEDALKKINNAASWVTAGSDPCEPYAVLLRVLYVPDCTTTGAKEQIDLPEFRWESINHDLKAGTVAVKGMCRTGLATKTRV